MTVTPGDKIKFNTDPGNVNRINEGYVYEVVGQDIFVSQNKCWEAIGFAQNWVIQKDQIIANYGPCDGCSF